MVVEAIRSSNSVVADLIEQLGHNLEFRFSHTDHQGSTFKSARFQCRM